jgi:hypothetical protein
MWVHLFAPPPHVTSLDCWTGIELFARTTLLTPQRMRRIGESQCRGSVGLSTRTEDR